MSHFKRLIESFPSMSVLGSLIINSTEMNPKDFAIYQIPKNKNCMCASDQQRNGIYFQNSNKIKRTRNARKTFCTST